MSKMNRLGNVTNKYQGDFKRVLCICSGGILRSPTTAVVLSQPPYNYNTRAAGTDQEFALVPVDDVLIEWTDEIVCMEKEHEEALRSKFKIEAPIYVLGIEDRYPYRDPLLISLITQNYNDIQIMKMGLGPKYTVGDHINEKGLKKLDEEG